MLSCGLFLAVFLPFFVAKSSQDVTFRDVTFQTYKLYSGRINKTIHSSDKIADFLSDSEFNFIEIKQQNVPVLRRNSLADLRRINEILIEYSNVEEIQPGVLRNSSSVTLLSLKGNKIKTIEFGVFNELQLMVIDLTSNKIETIDTRAFDNMKSLIKLRLDDNSIGAWNSNWFKNTPLLAIVSLQNNEIKEIPADAFKNLRGDKWHEDIFFNISLVFSHNSIRTIHLEAFSGLKKVNYLWLDHNLLEDFDENLLTGIRVESLRLNDNKIKCFKGELDKILIANDNHIDSNPFDCECLQTIKAFSKTYDKKVHFSMAEMDCTAQRIRTKMNALKNRLKELKEMNKTPGVGNKKEVEDVEVFEPKTISIK